MERKDKVEGEGSYTGSKDYNERTRKFVDSGKTGEAANDAKPRNEQEAHEMQKAERLGKKLADRPRRHPHPDPSQIQDDPNFPRKK